MCLPGQFLKKISQFSWVKVCPGHGHMWDSRHSFSLGEKSAYLRGAWGVIVIVTRNGYDDIYWNPERSRLHFT